MISITDTIVLDDSELRFSFVRASGPGGQNVNKVATAVQLHFDAARSPSLPGDVRRRLLRLAGRRLTVEGQIVIDARRYRSQEQNRQDALARLATLIRQAAVAPKARRIGPGPAPRPVNAAWPPKNAAAASRRSEGPYPATGE